MAGLGTDKNGRERVHMCLIQNSPFTVSQPASQPFLWCSGWKAKHETVFWILSDFFRADDHRRLQLTWTWVTLCPALSPPQQDHPIFVYRLNFTHSILTYPNHSPHRCSPRKRQKKKKERQSWSWQKARQIPLTNFLFWGPRRPRFWGNSILNHFSLLSFIKHVAYLLQQSERVLLGFTYSITPPDHNTVKWTQPHLKASPSMSFFLARFSFLEIALEFLDCFHQTA